MKLATSVLALLAFCLAAFLAVPISAKAPIDKLTIESPGLSAPIEITDADDMSRFHPGSRNFIDWDRGIASPPAKADPTYTVSFFQEGKKIYVLEYTLDPSGGSGYIYIPGPEHPAYRLNTALILTASTDAWDPNGKWQYATVEWDVMVEHALQTHGATRQAPAPTDQQSPKNPFPSLPDPLLWAISVTVVSLVVGIAVVTRRVPRH